MQTQNSTQDFISRLAEKDRERTTQLYTTAFKDKENIHRQSNFKMSIVKPVRSRIESISNTSVQASDKNWYLDVSRFDSEDGVETVGPWLNTKHGLLEFKKIINNGEWENEVRSRMDQGGMLSEGNRKSILVEIWCIGETSHSTVLIDYALSFLKYGKGTWSLAALTSNKRYDLLSLESEGTTLWKGKTLPSKLQLEREQLLRRVFGFAAEKQKSIECHQTLAKLQLKNNNVIYFVLRNAGVSSSPSNAQLMLEQETIIENITNVYAYSILRPEEAHFDSHASFPEVMKGLGMLPKKEESLSKRERQRYLKNVIDRLQSELEGKQTQLMIYRSQNESKEIVVEQQLLIPSERVSFGQQRYLQLKRQIREEGKQ